MSKSSHLLLIFCYCLMLTACNINPVEKPNAYTVEQEASEAYKNKQWNKAEKYYSELISLVPTNAEAWFRLGNVYVRNNKPDEAMAAYREAVIRSPDMGKAWYNMGTVSLRKTTHLYIEMLKYLDESSPLKQKAQDTADALLSILEQRKQSNVDPESAQAEVNTR